MRLEHKVGLVLSLAAALLLAGVSRGLNNDKEQGSFQITRTDLGYTLEARDAKLTDILTELDRLGAASFKIDPNLATRVTASLQDAPIEKVLEALTHSRALVYEQQDGSYTLAEARVTSEQEETPAPEQKPVALPQGKGSGELLPGVLSNAKRPIGELRTRDAQAILLRNAVIDTEAARTGNPLQVPPEFAASPDTIDYIVQFDHRLTGADREGLDHAGAKITHYVPNSAYAVRVNPADLNKVRALPGVSLVEPYHPYFKMGGDILDYMRGEASDDVAERVKAGKYNVLSFRGADLDAALQQAGATALKTQTVDGREMASIEADPMALTALLANDDVQWVETTPTRKPMNDLANRRIRATALKALHPTLTGTGVVVNVTDTGIDFLHPGFSLLQGFPTSTNLNTRIAYYEARTGALTSDGVPGDNNGHGSHVSGTILGNGALSDTALKVPGSGFAPYATNQFAGIAPGAKVVMLEDFNSFSDNEQAETAYAHGARLSNNSWGANVFDYSTLSAIWDALVRDANTNTPGNQEYIAFFAAGNAGDGDYDGTGGTAGTVGSPGNAKNVITVGAVEQVRRARNLDGASALPDDTSVLSDTDWQMAYFSSRGPVSGTDPRIKPDVVAPGVYVNSIQSHETFPDELIGSFDFPGWDYRANNVNTGTNYAFESGTSMATPVTTGGGALLYENFMRQYGKAPSPAMMKAMMVAGARLLNSIQYPLSRLSFLPSLVDQGWGMLDVVRSADGPKIHATDTMVQLDQDQTTPLDTDEHYSRQIVVNAGEGGLRIVLAWTDPAGTPGNAVQLVNDLDLFVFAPGGGGYLGNYFAYDGIESERLGAEYTPFVDIIGDSYNNVEVVDIPSAGQGTYTIQVHGYDVPTGPQDFALVIMKGVGIEGRTKGQNVSVSLFTNDAPIIAYSDIGPEQGVNNRHNIFVKYWVGPYGDSTDFGLWRRLDDQWFDKRNSSRFSGISRSAADSTEPSIAVAGQHIYVAWTEDELSSTTLPSRIYLRDYDGSDWQQLAGSGQDFGLSGNVLFDAQHPVVQVLTNGQPVVAWQQASLGTSRINVAYFNGTNWVGFGGSNSNGVPGGVFALNPDMIVDSLGRPVVAWEEPLTQKINVRRWNGTSTWTDLGQLGNAPLATSPKLAAGPNGEFYIAWLQFPDGLGSNLNTSVFVERYNGSFVQMANSATYPGVSGGTSTGSPVSLSISVRAGTTATNVYVAWQSDTNSGNSVFVKKFTGSSWAGVAGSATPPGIAYNTGESELPDMVLDSKGLPLVAFQNNATTNEEILVYTVVGDRSAPTFAGLQTATGNTNGTVSLSWQTAVDDTSTTIYYRIYRGTQTFACGVSPDCDSTNVFANLIGIVTNATSFTATNMTSNLIYCFGVRAVDTNGLEDANTALRSAGPVSGSGDNDGDCLANGFEATAGTEPCLKDTDGDGMWDGWEWTYSTNNPNLAALRDSTNWVMDPLDSGFDNVRTAAPGDGNTNQFAVADTDGDGASNYEEFQWWLEHTFATNVCEASSPTNRIGPSPLKKDTDGDGIRDGWEMFNGLNPADPSDAALDPDGDGLSNLQEFNEGTDPFNPDTDGDGLRDGVDEVFTYGTSPALADSDGDGLDDGYEVSLGTDPKRADSNGNFISDGDMVQLGLNALNATGGLHILLAETFEATSTTRSAWTHYAPNFAFPFDFWHLSTAEPRPRTNDIVSITDHTTNTAYRSAYDPTGTNLLATYSTGTVVIMALQAPTITNATTVSNLFVAWNEYYETEPTFDQMIVQARGGSATNWINISTIASGLSGVTNYNDTNATARWVTRVADASQFAGRSNVQVRFLFNVLNNNNNDYRGWWVDDVRVYEGTMIRGWVRDNNGRAVQGAVVRALGRGGVTNVINGQQYVLPGKIFGEAQTAQDGSYVLSGLPQGNYYVKASAEDYIDEFHDGLLFSGAYAFGAGAGQHPGVASREAVTTNGIVGLTLPGAQTNIYFELERGLGRACLGVSLPNSGGLTYPIFVDGVAGRVWNGSTGSAAFTSYLTSTNANLTLNHPDWLTNAVQPLFNCDLAPGVHRPYAGTNLVLYPLPEVTLREGETTRLIIRTNQAVGRLFVSAADLGSYALRVDGRTVTNRTPALLPVRAGLHEVLLVITSAVSKVAPKFVTVPVGDRTAVTFSSNDLTAAAGALKLSATDIFGGAVTGVSVYVNGILVTTNDVATGLPATLPTTLSNLRPGQHVITLTKNGYRPSDRRSVVIFSGVTNVQNFILYQADEDYDRVGDEIEVAGYTNIFLYHRDSDPDGDGLSNLAEFDIFRLFGVRLNAFNPDSDGDGAPDGAEVGYDGNTNRFALSVLYTNAAQFASNVKVLFVGDYLAGADNFGTGSVPVSIEGDRFVGLITHPTLTVPTKDPALTIFTNVVTFPSNVAVNVGHATSAAVFSDGRPDRVDTDGDGMWDGFEYAYGLGTVANLDLIEARDADADPDSDGLTSYYEFLGIDQIANTNDWSNPGSSDSDGDNIPDGWEYQHGFSPIDASDAFSDVDGDGLVNLGEYFAGTDPRLRDTDADFLPDFEEVVIYGTDPNNYDTDGDGLLDGQEVYDKDMDGVRDGGFFPQWAGGDLDNDGAIDGPTDWDTDGDGMPDGFEVLDNFGNIRPITLDPYDPTDGDEDPDGDGLSNLQEYLVRDALFGNHPSSFSLFRFAWYGRVPPGWDFTTAPYAPEYPTWDYSTDPFNADTDGDSMPDGFEVLGGLHPVDPVPVDGSILVRYRPLSIDGDPDGDGLWNDLEFKVRFALDGTASTNDPSGLSTSPWLPDTDNDGLDDGEEHHAMLSNPVVQDTDGDRLMDGTGISNTWGEVESSLRRRFAFVDCPGCSWIEAYTDALTQPSPDDPSILGHLADIDDAREMLDVVTLINGRGTNIAIGVYDASHNNTFATIGQDGVPRFIIFQNFGTNLPVVSTDTNGTGVTIDPAGNFSAAVWTNAIVDHYVVEWDGASVDSNNYDEAYNDLWQMYFPSDAGFGAPYWSRVEPNTNAMLPPPRWGQAMVYVPGYEIKDQDPTHDPHLGIGTHVLLDNRKVVIMGGRNGVETYGDIWEYWIKSNEWTRSTLTLGAGSVLSSFSPDMSSGLSELSAVLLMGYSNTKDPNCDCGNVSYNCEGIAFGEPKNRPWDNGYQDSSYDLMFILGGWNDEHWYAFNEPMETFYYKSTDDLNLITEDSKTFNNIAAHDVWQSAEGRLFVNATSGVPIGTAENLSRTYADLSAKQDDRVNLEDGSDNNQVPLGHFVAQATSKTNDNIAVTTFPTNKATAIRIDQFPFKVPCDRIVTSDLFFVISAAPTNDLDLFVVAEFNQGDPHTSEAYVWNEDNQAVASGSPLERAAGRSFVTTNSVAFTIPAGSNGLFQVDVTPLVQEIALAGGWQGRAIGFVITNEETELDNAIMEENSAYIRVSHNPSYRVPATWHRGSRVQVQQGDIPSMRKSFGMTYDYNTDRIVVFGGMNGRQVFGETYEGTPIFGEEDEDIPITAEGSRNADVRKVRLVVWQRVFTTQTPAARWGHSMVYDDVNNRSLMFGGFDKDNKPLNDLWAYYVGVAITNAAVDTNGVTNVTVSATESRWVQIADFQDSQRPSPRGGAAMVWAGGHFYERGTTRYRAGKRNKLVLFGGTDGKNYYNDTWYYDENEVNYDINTTNLSRWVLADPGGPNSPGPGPRAFATMQYAQNGGLVPDPAPTNGPGASLGPFAIIDGDTIRRASATIYMFGGRRGTLPGGADTDRDLVDDGQEHELGGPAAGRDPRVNGLYIDSTNALETVPFTFKRIGTWAGALPNPNRAPIADMEALNFQERLHGWRMGAQYVGTYIPWQGYPLETTHTDSYFVITDETIFPVELPQSNYNINITGVNAMSADWTNMWFHRHGLGNPQDPRDEWELGIPDNSILGPTGAPPYAYSGRWVYGTDLNGTYANNAVMELFSPIFDLKLPQTPKTSTGTNNFNSFFLLFHEWLDLADPNDVVRVDLVRPSTGADIATRVTGLNRPVIQLVPNRNNLSNTGGKWRRMIVPLDVAANESNLYVRFTLQSDSNNVRSAGGWYLDDVAILQGSDINGLLSAPAGTEVCLLGEVFNNHLQACTSVDANGAFKFGFLPLGNYRIVGLGITNGPYALSGPDIDVMLNSVPPPEFTWVGSTPSPVVITWTATNGLVYKLDYTTNILTGGWVPLAVRTGGADSTLSYTDALPTVDRIYRVAVTNAP